MTVSSSGWFKQNHWPYDGHGVIVQNNSWTHYILVSRRECRANRMQSVDSVALGNLGYRVDRQTIKIEEFDPGSERMLTAWLRHASRTNLPSGKLVAKG